MKINLKALQTFGGPKVQRAALKIGKYAPEILTVVGLVSGVASTVLIAKATLKLEILVLEFQERVRVAKWQGEHEGELEQDYQRELAKVYIWFGFELIKLYGPGVSLGLGSIASILGAHGIMKRRQVAILAAYATVESAFKEYRRRVIEEFGEQKDIEYRAGVVTQKIKDEETGKTKTVKTFDPTDPSKYARFFDESNENWKKSAEYNMAFLHGQQNWANDRLIMRGHLFLNEVYDDLGYERTKAGNVVGWVLQKDNVNGDNYVDFGLYNFDSPAGRAFVNGEERSILLDFNVDGVILDLI